jgi:hypothetical protein
LGQVRGERESRVSGERESRWGVGERESGRRERESGRVAGESENRERRRIPKRCRCEALQRPAEQSEAIPNGLASTIIPTYGVEIIHHEAYEEV